MRARAPASIPPAISPRRKRGIISSARISAQRASGSALSRPVPTAILACRSFGATRMTMPLS